MDICIYTYNIIYRHHKHPCLGHLTRSVSRVTAALSIASSVSQLFSFLVGCRGMISSGFGFVVFFVCVRASSFCIHLSCLVCSLSVVRGEWICLLLHPYFVTNCVVSLVLTFGHGNSISSSMILDVNTFRLYIYDPRNRKNS